MIDRVDANDRPVGVVPRGHALEEHANFRTAHVFVFDRAGRLLLQRLARTRERHPGRWGSSAAAYLFSGETYAEAAERRMAEELGVRGQPRFFGKIRMRDFESTKFVALFEFVSEHAGIAEPDHIEELKFWPLGDLQEAVERNPDGFTPTFLQLFSFFLRGDEHRTA